MILDYRTVYLLLGSNLGHRHKLVNDAVDLINKRIGDVISRSSLYETAAWGVTDQPAFLNVAVEVKTQLSPLQVLDQALEIEQMLGRVRLEKWGARLIDIDLIFYGDEIIDFEGRLQVPHPQLQNRKFVLQPLAEIAPHYIHPFYQKSVSELLAALTDELPVTKINSIL
ncbi:MAG: 2-amino-4-hydroxy-6-hydroxymethyldihydropteridine diphosphokinase [Bacteroidota bacterium]